MPDDIWLRALLRNAKDIAILGAKDKPGQPVDGVGRYLLRQGYKIWPVHPARATVWGLAAYQDLAALPKPVDIIDVFRAPCLGGPKFSGCSQALSRPKRGNCLRRRAWPWWKTPA